ncbi:MAG: metallophosphoesterase [Candidatus Alcyoniella australis]|nr:metallophosphoesterase [Candidatus Alcyoniella australis]
MPDSRCVSALALLLLLTIALPSAALGAITKGPYIQNVQRGSAAICLESDQPGQAVLEWGESDEYGNVQTSDPELIHVPEISFTVYQHVIPIYGLDSGALYHYRVSLNGELSDDHTLRTAPHNLDPYLWVAMGDSRGGSIATPNVNHEATVEQVLTWDPDFVVNTGDLVSSGEVLADWDYFFHASTQLMYDRPLFPVFGNHESDWDPNTGLSGDGNFVRLFELSPTGGAEHTYYSFDWGNAHYCVIDGQKQADLLIPGSPQRIWIQEDLAAAHADLHTNFTFVFFHMPAFSFKEERNGDFTAKLVLEPLFEDYEVDIVFNGHDHHYARAFLWGRNHVLTGGGGAPLYDFCADVEDEQGYRAHDKSYHYVVLEVDPQMVEVTAYRTYGGDVIDRFVIVKDEPPVPYDDDDDDDDDDDLGDDDDDDDGGGDHSGGGDDDDDDSGGCGG